MIMVRRMLRAMALFGLSLGLSLVMAAAPVEAASSLAETMTGPDWPHTRADFKPDDNARFGRLANGMRYVIYRNTAKGRSTSMRFLVAAGSLQERDDQLGMAHFVEHMAFRGSKNLKDGELARILKVEGFGFGSDVNAFTDYEATKYVLDLPSNDQEPIESAMFILREIAGNLTFDGEAIEHERGVILGEERMRASAYSRSQEAMLKVAYPQSLYPKRNPIGTLDSIRNAPRQALIDYYQDWYRPELAVLVVVGDFDVNGMEKRIRTVFGDWKPARPGPVRHVSYAPAPLEGVHTVLYAEKNLYEGIGVAWFRAYIDQPDTLASRTTGFNKNVAITVMNERFAHAAEDPASAFLSAQVTYDNNRLGGNVTSLWVVPKPGRQKDAYLQALRMVNRLKADGVTAAELSDYVATTDAQMENMVRTYQTRFSNDIAEEILSTLTYDNVFETAEQLRSDWARVKPALTTQAVADKIAVIFNSPGQLLSRQGEDAAVLDEAELRAAFAEAQASPDTGPAVTATTVAWPYTSFGPPARTVDKVKVKQLGYTRYTLSNGVKVNIRSNALVKNQIIVKVRFGGGYLLFSPADKVSLAQLAMYELKDGGLGKLSQVQIDRTLSTKTVSFDYDLNEDAAVLTGYTTRDSFAIQMQLLMAFAVDPGFRPEMFENVRGGLDYMYQQIRGSPDMTMGFGATAWLAGGDPRYVLPAQAEMAQRRPDEIIAIYRRTLTGAPVEITIAGDIREDAALDQVRRTFGNLPAVPETVTVAPGADVIKLPTDRTPQVFRHEGRADQAMAMVVFPATDALSHTDDTRGLMLLAEIFNARLDDDLRQRQGMAYDGNVSLTASETMKGFGYISAEGTIPPDKEQVFFDTVLKIAADLVGKTVTSDELERARNPMVQYMSDQNKNNEDWQRTLGGLYGNPVLWDYRVSTYKKFMDVTPYDIQVLAKRYLKPDAVLRAKTVPSGE